jgi:hypothetical protein
MRKSKAIKQKKHKLNKALSIEGRTKRQRKGIMMKNAINSFDGNVTGETLKEKYQHMHKQIAFDKTEQKRIEELENE